MKYLTRKAYNSFNFEEIFIRTIFEPKIIEFNEFT
jgi:hypothetical protein